MIENVKPSLELRTLARSNARSYLTKSVHPKLVGEEVASGWQVLKKRKTSVRLKKAKSQGTFLEDRVWMLLYRMQFEFLSGVGGGKLWLDSKDGEGPKNQIDVVGIEEDLALAIECKSQENYSKRNKFQEELAKLAAVRERFSRATNSSQFPGSHTYLLHPFPLSRPELRHYGRACASLGTWREKTLSSSGDLQRENSIASPRLRPN